MRSRLLVPLAPLIVVFLMMQDARLLRAIQGFNPPGWKMFMEGITLSADFFVLLSLLGLCWIVGAVKQNDTLARIGRWGFPPLIAVRVVVGLLKTLIGRGRPSVVDTFDHPIFIGPTLQIPFHSFPSAHTSSAFSVAALVSTLCPPLQIPVLFWAACIGLSRVVLNEHFVSDVVAGGILGYGLTLMMLKVVGRREGAKSCLR